MTLSRKILLSMCISFSLHAMNNQQLLDEYPLINNVCVKAWNMLDGYNPENLGTIDNVSAIISTMKSLKYQGIDAVKIGKFAYEQPFINPHLKNPSYDKKKHEWYAGYPYNKYRYVSLLIPLIEEYNKNENRDTYEHKNLMTAIKTIRNADPEEINKRAQVLYDSVKL
jgi:hypothetical protein